MSVVLKITTPIQLAGVIVVGIIQMVQISSSPLSIISLTILGGLAVMAVVVIIISKKQENKYLLDPKEQENEFLIRSGMLRLQDLIEWITDVQRDINNKAVTKELEIRLRELKSSLNWAQKKRKTT